MPLNFHIQSYTISNKQQQQQNTKQNSLIIHYISTPFVLKEMINGRDNNNTNNNNNKALVKLKAQPPSDLLVCFPTRAHLSLKPKAVCSPSRPNGDPIKRLQNPNSQLRRVSTRAASSAIAAGGPGSPHVWSKDNQIRGGGPEMSEPTSPKVTCAGQIKVRPRSSNGTPSSCRNWQSIMEEIEKIHNRAKFKKKSSWGGSLGFKKDVTSFLTCLRNLRFDFHCFGSFPDQVLSSDDEDEDEDEDVVYDEGEDTFEEIIDDNDVAGNSKNNGDFNDDNNNAVFSKWFMVLQENQSLDNDHNNRAADETENDDFAPAVPPPNALLLMRCRSAPTKSWLEEKENDEKSDNLKSDKDEKAAVIEDNKEDKDKDEDEEKIKKKRRETLAIVMKYDTDFYKLSTDVAQETWVVGEFKDPFSRSRSWRR